MGNVIGKYLRGLMGPRVAVTISYPPADESPILDPAEALPTSEPASPQISKTIAAEHLPTWTPFELPHILVANLYVGGRNGAGSAATVYYRVKRNGVDVATGSGSVNAGNYWTMSIYKYMAGLAVGDTITVYLWASIVGVNWDYKALACKIGSVGPGIMVAGLKITFPNAPQPVLVLGNPYAGSTSHVQIWWETEYLDTNTLGLPSQFDAAIIASHKTFGFFRATFGHASDNISLWQHASYRPYYVRDASAPTAISFRPVNLRL